MAEESSTETLRQDSSREDERERLTRARIVEAAIDYIDHQGLTSLSMRRLGKQLGVEAMALYRHVNGREDLLEGIVDSVMADLEVDPGDALGSTDGWQVYLQWLAHQVRAMAVAHPSVFPLIATRHPAAPWLRPPLRSLRVVEQFLDAMLDRGLDEPQAVAAYRAFSSFLLGHLLLETAMLGASTAPVEEPLDEGDADLPNQDAHLGMERFPTLARLRAQLSVDDTDAEFERALEALLDRLDMGLSQ